LDALALITIMYGDAYVEPDLVDLVE